MWIRRTNRLVVLCASAAAMAAASPATAVAEHRQQPVDAKATITGCAGDGLTIAAELAPAAADGPAARRALRAIRRATLRLRFEAAPLYGPTRRSREIDLGRTTAGRRFERFGDLPAQTYTGAVRYRWVRGGRTVLSGLVRTSRVRAAGRRGRAACSLRVGKKPVDTRPPLIVAVPSDPGWKRGPLNVYLWAVDDLSGVALVVWRLDGGSFTRGHNVQIASEGSHQLTYVARDAAGNQTAPATVTLRVDTNAPTEPTLAAPSGTTTDSTPDLRWKASTDSGSGVSQYIALVRNAGGTIVWSQVVAPSAAPSVTVGQALAPGAYTAEVVAIDAVTPPHGSKATSSFSVVGSSASPADSDGDSVVDASDNCPFAANADQTDSEGDGAGNACDSDDDNDTLSDETEASRGTSPTSADTDADGDGDAQDNCPVTSNANQANFDGDGQGDACDSDDDNDGLADSADPNDNSDDSDGDGFKDGVDPCPAEPEAGVDLQPEGCP
jgi:hypothetical protein